MNIYRMKQQNLVECIQSNYSDSYIEWSILNLKKYLSKDKYVNNSIYSWIFIMKSYMGFAIVVIYMNDLNPVETLKEFKKEIWNEIF